MTTSIASQTTTRAAPRTARWLALGAVAGPLLFMLAWVVLGFLSPGYTAWGIRFAPYSPIVQPISGLGLGPTAPFMNAAFVLGGLLLLAGVVGIFQAIGEIGAVARWTCIVLLAPTPLGMAMDGIFTLESGFLHFAGFGLGCGMLVLSFPITGLVLRRIPRWRRFGGRLLLAGPLTLALLILYFATFDQALVAAGQGVAGLTERILVVEAFAWLVAMGWLAFRRS
jgi:hypothetical protein